MNLQEHLESLGACKEAREWAGDKSATEVWQTCTRPDWMLWWAMRTAQNNKTAFVLLAILIADSVADLCNIPEAKKAVDAARSWVANPTEENSAAAYAAAYAAYAAAYAADAAADAAAYAAYAAYAADAAYAAAGAAADATVCTLIRTNLAQPSWAED